MADARPPDNRAEMPFLDHLEELRWRILYSLLAIVIATLIGWVIVQHVDVIGLLIQPIKPLIPGGKLRVTSPTEPFLITLKFAFVVGLVLASPIVGYQAWAFLAPALYERERRLIVPALSVGALLFLGGASAAYLWVLPRALTVLLGFQQTVFDPLITADRYFAFAAQLIIAFGVITELPLVVVILAALGLVTPQFLARNRRYAIALSAGAAALLAPPDAVSMLLMMVPLWLLYEVSIWCAWVVERRRARRGRASAGGPGGAGATSTAALAGLLFVLGGHPLASQGVPGGSPLGGSPLGQPRVVRPDTGRAPGDTGATRALDTATARRLGLPTAPKRSFPASDAILDSLLKLRAKYRVTQYLADTLIVQGGDSGTIHLRGDAFSEREGTKLEADSIRYLQHSCRLDAKGDPHLFEQARVLVGEGMGYDTCIRRGTVHNALTSVQQSGALWYVRGDLAVDSGQTRIYGAQSEITSDDNPVPDYHFATGEMKWLNKDVMVARPAMLYVHDVPIMWLPFIFQDVRRGRRSGILVPRFGLSDLVRPTRSYHRHIANVGYYFALNDYFDLLASVDWYADRYFATRSQVHYRWLDRFLTGGIAFERFSQLDTPGNSIRLGWNHQQSFSSRTNFNASIDYATSTQVIQTNTVNPYLATAQLGSQASFTKQFDWGTLAVGGTRRQPIGPGPVTQGFPTVALTPSPVNVTPSITWSPGFSFSNQQTFNQAQPLVLASGAIDTLFSSNRQTALSVQTPLRIGRWTWNNTFQVNDATDNARQEVDIKDSTVAGGVRRVVYYRTFSTGVDWQTGINLPSFFTGTWNLQPGLAIVNQTGATPYFRLRNQFTGGQWVQQGKRPQFSVGISPTFFGFFPGFGPIDRIRHSISPIVSYAYAPGSRVSAEFARAVDPIGQNFRAQSDPQQTINLGLSQNFEAKLKPPPGDTTARAVRKIRLLSINTSGVSYNFEQAKQPRHTGWQTQTLSNAFASDLLPGFSLSTTHDLWRGQVGTDTAQFDPFLTNVAASFTIRQATLDGIARLLGLGGHAAPPTPSAPGAAPGGAPPAPGGPEAGFGTKSNVTPGALPLGGGGQGFSLSVQYTVNRPRPNTTPLPAGFAAPLVSGQRTLGLNLAFQPSPKWSATWNSNYDFDLQQFGMHVIRLERDLHRWHASFSFTKIPSGSFAFSFFVSLLDQPDIKFNYEQATFAH